MFFAPSNCSKKCLNKTFHHLSSSKGLGMFTMFAYFFTTPFSFLYLFIFSIVIKNNGRWMVKLLLLYYNITSFFGSNLLIRDFCFWFRKINVYGSPSRLATSLLVTLFFYFIFLCVCVWKISVLTDFFWLLSLQ